MQGKMAGRREKGEILNMKQVGWMTGHRRHARGRHTHNNNNGKYQGAIPRKYRYSESPLEGNVLACARSRFSIKVCPNANQLVLAFTTLLFFASFECLLLTIMTVGPGLEGRRFESTRCRVINSFYNGNTSCYVSSISTSAAKNIFPCLQIYVEPALAASTTAGNRTKRELHEGDASRSSGAETINRAMEIERSRRAASQDGQPLLMFQSELNFAGNDYMYRRCSYLPRHCPQDLNAIQAEISSYERKYGRINQTYQCYYSALPDSSGDLRGRVMRQKLVSVRDMVYSLLWPLLGMLASALGCVGFWRRNYKRMSRLFIYNSWSAS